MVNAGNLVLANYYESRLMSQVEDLIGTTPPKSFSLKEFKDYAKDNATQSLAIEGYKAIESEITQKVTHQRANGVMVTMMAG